jgi:hypothetical protein
MPLQSAIFSSWHLRARRFLLNVNSRTLESCQNVSRRLGPPNYYVVRDANKQQLAYVYFENEPGAALSSQAA